MFVLVVVVVVGSGVNGPTPRARDEPDDRGTSGVPGDDAAADHHAAVRVAVLRRGRGYWSWM